MSLITNGFNTGTNGAALTVASSGETGSALGAEPTLAGNGKIVFSDAHPAHGGMGIWIKTAGGSDRARADWYLPETTSQMSVYLYVYLDALPGAATNLGSIVDASGSGLCNIVISSTGKLQMSSKTGTVSPSGWPILQTGVMYRIGMATTVGTGTTDGKVKGAFAVGDADFTTDGSNNFEVTNTNVGTSGPRRFYLAANAVTNLNAYIDDLRIDNSIYSLMNYVPIASAPSLTLTGGSSALHPVIAAGVAAAGGALSYTISASAGQIASNPLPGVWLLNRAASTGADYSVTVTTTEAGSGLSTSKSITVPKQDNLTPAAAVGPRIPAGAGASGNTWA